MKNRTITLLGLITLIIVSLYLQGCGELDDEPSIPDYLTIKKRHLSHVPDATITGHHREGSFVTYYAERKETRGRRYLNPITVRIKYTIIYELIDREWVYVNATRSESRVY